MRAGLSDHAAAVNLFEKTWPGLVGTNWQEELVPPGMPD
jgi:hypothetical protein